MTLNTCASMKLEVHFQRKQSEDPEEGEDVCGNSSRWAFQSDSQRWSCTDSDDFLSSSLERLSSMRKESSRESLSTDLSADLEATSLQSHGSTGQIVAVRATPPGSSPVQTSPALTGSIQSLSDHSPTDPSPPLSWVSKEKTKKCRTRSFLRRLESLRRKDKEKLDSVRAGEEGGTESSKDIADPPPGKRALLGRGISSPFQSSKNLLSADYQTHQVLAGNKPQFEPKHGSVYLEDCEGALVRGPSRTARGFGPRALREQNCLVHLPKDHKPGTFPRSLSVESLHPLESGPVADWGRVDTAGGAGRGQSSRPEAPSLQVPRLRGKRPSLSSAGSCTSLYDNVPELGSSDNLFDLDTEVIYESLDDVLQHVWGLQQKVELWSRGLRLDLECRSVEGGEEETDSGGEPATPNFEERSISDTGTSASDFDSTGNSLNEAEDTDVRERRDSGVGASLTRPCRKLRWHSFQNSHRPSLTSASLEISHQSAAQLHLLQKCSLLCLTAIMEKYAAPHKQTWAWTVPKFMKRSKAPSYKDKVVFGVPPVISVQRTGQPLPQSIQQAMRYLRRQCLDQVGIFRKSGVKSRIQALRLMNEVSPEGVDYDGQSAYDVADLLKQYFRDLPEPVFTSKLTDTFLQIYQFVPREQRLQATQAAIALMPDENREVLQTLLYFLSDIAAAQENQMTAGNLAVCLAPSLFHLNASKKESPSPRMVQKRGTVGKPDQKDLNENMAATQALSHMITGCKKLFQVPQDMMLRMYSSCVSADAHPALSVSELMSRHLSWAGTDSPADLEASVQSLLKEASERFKGWLSAPGPQNTEMSSKKAGDGYPLRVWKVSTVVEAPPQAVLRRVLRERHLWDEDLLQGRVMEALGQNTEVYHHVADSMGPHPRREFVVLRRWHTDLPRGACLLVSLSLDHKKMPPEGGVRAVILTSQYLMEPLGMGCSKVTHICRADLRGRSPEWYSRVFGHLCAMELVRIRNSFPGLNSSGPETKI
ncbi:PREDICTED: stAR-related lipid transfer protein 8 [Gekko japonicus]|uniref:StAR-related lipid transfer protein 8 n=1 Tax=Gekko japonicus TaxID=146911 RepID=A0ABM1K6Z1_GEKJA|nr:PREDICTED: stAR-related lipid transfer protein 8 [Gekko japonicus]